MPATTHLRAAPFVLAVAVSAALVLSAPFVGQIRAEIRRAFPGQFVLIVGGIIALGLLAAVVVALRQVRDRRGVRYRGMMMSLVVAGGYAAMNASDSAESNVVELFHFLQYGLIAFLFYRAWRPLGDPSIVGLPLLAALIVGTAEEWLQWFIPNRVGEMKDVFLNLAAIGTGLMFSVSAHPPGRWAWSLHRSSPPRLARIAAAALVSFAAFFHAVHLGHFVEDDEIGMFDSRWPRTDLLATQAAKRAEWTATPPPLRLVRLSEEDQYLTEGIQHVRERNELWEKGDFRGAWLENRILEEYFEPVLDTPTHEGAGHRWSAEQRAVAASRAASQPATAYVSSAYPYRLYKWSRTVFWIPVGLGTGVLLLISRRRSPSSHTRDVASGAGEPHGLAEKTSLRAPRPR
jgi:hypothetical protein